MRRLHLRGRTNILKRYQVHVAALNLGIVLRSIIGLGTPRGFQGKRALLADAFSTLLSSIHNLIGSLFDQFRSFSPDPLDTRPLRSIPLLAIA